MKIKRYIIFALITITLFTSLSFIMYASYFGLNYTVNYISEDGEILHESAVGTADMSSDTLEIVSPVIQGYKLKNEEQAVISYSSLHIDYSSSHYDRYATGECDVVYIKTHKISVYHNYANGEKAYVTYITNIGEGETFSYSSPSISGFVCDIKNINEQVVCDKEYTITYYPISYSITYDYDNGNESFVDYKYHNTPYTIKDTIPYKDGYIFSHYLDNGITYYPSHILNENRDYYLKAIYSISSCTVHYDGNGGTCTIEDQIKEYNVPLILSPIIPTREEYSFVGWGLKRTDTIPSYYPSSTYTDNYSITLFAIWEKSSSDYDSITISYSTMSDETESFVETKEKGIPYYISSIVPKKTGFTFEYWVDENNSIYVGGDEYSKDVSLSLTAVYSSYIPSSYYTVTFDPGDGYFPIESETIDSNSVYRIPETKPYLDGYIFEKWYTNDSFTGISFSPGEYYGKKKDVTLYAHYLSLDETFVIHYELNNGYSGPDDTLKKKGIDAYISFVIPHRLGYTFLTWNTTKNGTGVSYAPSSIYKDDSSITLYAIWSENKSKYTISYDFMGGNSGPENQTKTENEDIVISYTVPKKTGYFFIGWSKEKYGEIHYKPGDTYKDNSNITLYAQYTRQDGIYTIVYDTLGGEPNIESTIKYTNETVYITDVIPYKENSSFLGWGISPYNETPSYYPLDEYTENESIYLYALYEPDLTDLVVTDLVCPDYYDGGNVYVKAYVYNDSSIIVDNIKVNLYLNSVLYSSSDISLIENEYGCLTYLLTSSDLNNSDNTLNLIINEERTIMERDYTNNNLIKTIKMKEKSECEIIDIHMEDEYYLGEDIYISYFVKNNSSYDILPHNKICAYTEVFTLSNDKKEIIFTSSFDNIPIPKGEKNLVYFKLNIPNSLKGKVVFIHNIVNGNDILCESKYNFTPKERINKYQEETVFEYSPSNYHITDLIEEKLSLTYETWEYNGYFTKKSHSFYPMAVLNISPSTRTPFFDGEDGRRYIKSGYPIDIVCTPALSITNDSLDNVIIPKSILVVFPETNFSEDDGITLSYDNGSYIVPSNPYTGKNSYYTRLYTKDGEYHVFCTITYMTPGGLLYIQKQSNSLYINSSLYSDWYTGE